MEAAAAEGMHGEIKEQVKWLFESVNDMGKLHLLNGQKTSYFSKHDVWRVLVLCRGTNITTEELYKKNKKVTCVEYYEQLLAVLNIQPNE